MRLRHGELFVARYRVELTYSTITCDFSGDCWFRTDFPGDGYYRKLQPSTDPNVIYEDVAEDVAAFLTQLPELARQHIPLF